MSRIRQGGGFGFVILLVVMAVILFLASRSSKKLLPTALHVAAPARTGHQGTASPTSPPPSVNSGAGQAPIQSSLSDTKTKTADHSAQIEDALKDR